MKRIVTVRDSDGRVLSQWAGGDAQELASVAGLTHIVLESGDATDYGGHRWTGTRFERIPAPPLRVLSPIEFARRFTLAEEISIDTLSATNLTVKAWMRRVSLATSINLDHPDVAAGLAYLKSIGIPAIWPDTATADRRAAEIRANG